NYRNYPNTNVGFYPKLNYGRNISYNRNYGPPPYYPGYGIVNQSIQPLAQRRFVRRTSRQKRISQNRPRTHSSQRQSRLGQQRKRFPRQIRLNEFMPVELRQASPSLPVDFNLATTAATTTASNINNGPVDALPQRVISATNTTQPFDVNNENNNQQRQTTITTTTSFRRRQRRVRQQQYRENQNVIENNRFDVLPENDSNEDVDLISNVDGNEPTLSTNSNKRAKKKKDKKKKNRAYFAYDRIMAWVQNETSSIDILDTSGNHAYFMASIPIYDEWIRANYDIQVWQHYLKMGTENKHWAKEIIQQTKKRDDFVKATTTTAAPVTPTTATTAQATVTSKPVVVPLCIERIRSKTDELEKLILKYLQHCTQHVKKMHETHIQLAKIQMDEVKALEEFEQIATPSQWNIHLALKSEMKLWSTKHKNYLTATKRVEYDIPPKFIEKVDLSFKIDASIINQDEA
ncbi:unnamed protein product, partial [Rotaria sp. Silwood1]